MVKDYFKDGSDGLLESRVTPLMLTISLVGQEASAEAVDLILKQTNLGISLLSIIMRSSVGAMGVFFWGGAVPIFKISIL